MDFINQFFSYQFLFYFFRWQCSTPTLAVISVAYLAWRRKEKMKWPSKDEWVAAILANAVGSILFFVVDKCIFK